MAIECPICKSERTYKQRKFLRDNVFGCHSCGWEITQKEFHKQGGTEGIRRKSVGRKQFIFKRKDSRHKHTRRR